MAKAAFSCRRCNRTFSMAAHLARHMSAMHGAKKTRSPKARKAGRTRRRKGMRRATARTAGAPFTGAAGVVVDRALRDLRSCHDELVTQRTALDEQIAAVDNALQSMGGGGTARRGPARRGPRGGRRGVRRGARRGPGRGAGRVGRAGSLKEYVIRVLRQNNRPMKPREIASRVKSAGYKTKASDLTKAVSNAMPELTRRKKVKKAGFGLYQVAAGA